MFLMVTPSSWVCQTCFERYVSEAECLTIPNWFEVVCQLCGTNVGERRLTDIKMESILKQRLEKHHSILAFFWAHDGLIDWTRLPPDQQDAVLAACRDDVIWSSAETESYQVTFQGARLIEMMVSA